MQLTRVKHAPRVVHTTCMATQLTRWNDVPRVVYETCMCIQLTRWVHAPRVVRSTSSEMDAQGGPLCEK